MKKAILGLSLLLGAVSANAAIVPVDASYGLTNATTYNFTETSTDQYFEFFSSYNSTLTLDVLSGEVTAALFTDATNIFGNGTAEINANTLVTNTGLLFSTSSLVTYALNAGQTYVLRLRGDATAPFAVAAAVATVPVPAAAWLFGSAVMGFGALRRKKNALMA